MADFVEVELSRKQVLTIETEKGPTGKILAPGGGSFLLPLKNIHVREENPDRVYFSFPAGTVFSVQYGQKKEGMPEGTPKEQLYENVTKSWTIEDLKAAYEEERRSYFEENSEFVNMAVPTEWGKPFSTGKGEFVSISIPIDHKYYSFVVSKDHFKESERDEGMSYFGFPRKKKDSDEEYLINLRNSEKQADGTYVNTDVKLSSAELKKRVDEAIDYAAVKDMFVSAEISEKLVRSFNSNDGKALNSISVPVFDKEANKEIFYEIVVPEKRVKLLENGKVRLSLFKNGPDETPYTFTAKRSVKNEGGGYDSVDLKLTSEEVVNCFNASKERFKSQGNGGHTLADEMNGAAPAPEEAQAQQPSFRRHGR